MRKSFAILLITLLLSGCASSSLRMLVGTYTEGTGSVGAYLFEFDEDDATFHLLDTAAAGSPSFIVPSRDGKHAWSVGEFDDGRQCAYSYSITGSSIDVLNSRPADGEHSGASPCNIVIHSGYAFTSNYSGGSISVFPVPDDGTLGEMSCQFAPAADTAGAVSHIHCAVPSPDGKYLFVTDLGLDAVYRFTIGDSGDPLRDATVACRFDRGRHPGPRHLIFSQEGRFAYLLHELSDELTVLRYDAGVLQPILTLTAYSGEGHGSADLHLSPDGRFLYTSHRLNEDGISVFAVNPEDGTVKNTGYCRTGRHPRNFAITPNGRYLLCACRDSDAIEIYSINPSDGLLSPTGKKISVPAPVCIQLF